MLEKLEPRLLEEEFVFLTFPGASYGAHSELHPIASFQEGEGLTLIVPCSQAEKHGHAFEEIFRCISLGLNSSLVSVGLTAAFSGLLARNGISANVFAGFFHDHILVPALDADQALLLLTHG